MLHTVIPRGYAPCLNLYDTQKAIGLLKRLFEDNLGGALHLRRVSAPLFVEASTGLNDDLNGVERPVSFDIPHTGRDAQVVHSLAKWKRMALYRYQFSVGEGLYTDMNAIRRDEELDNIHSVYVDQWDWEKVIAPRDRNVDYLQQTVRYHCGRSSGHPGHPEGGVPRSYGAASGGSGGGLCHYAGAGGPLARPDTKRAGRRLGEGPSHLVCHGHRRSPQIGKAPRRPCPGL